MTQTYRDAFPNDKVVINPLLQMQRHLTDANRAAGNPAADDFLALLTRFGDAWTIARPGSFAASFITSLEYRDRSLVIGLQPGNGPIVEKIRTTLLSQRMTITQNGNDVWQIRSGT